ncbi:DUF1702 family protein [Leptothoe spongobia]|uniref:DUF1702 family protein n=1 Tax=Leptothoe spongobia TAU-MAC 1115 TaxID=1967444 RepID=A0A947DCQ7_9CYAN|nr:DUF1702 family protein [Leptothoe spongobia]MBT9314705.1 DUF1702 family protein [Leptothoe spongobia TAU-MAC 1115]
MPTTSSWGQLKEYLFGLSPQETTFDKRGFRVGNPQAQQRLEKSGRIFLQGYHAALADDQPETLAQRLNTVENEWRGFAFEGAAMGLALLDALTPWQCNRLENFIAGPGTDHIYMVHVGAGWVLAKLPWRLDGYLAQLHRETNTYREGHNPTKFKIQNSKAIDPLLGWLAIDGYGFHEGYFHWSRVVEQQIVPKKLSGYARRVFDQGLGRSLWFLCGADFTHIPDKINAFEPMRHPDLWSGLGLACAYAGGVDQVAIATLQTTAGAYRPQLAQGAAFAAKARQRAGNPAPHTTMACQVLCGMDVDAAAALTDSTLQDLPFDEETPAYEIWRQRIQSHFAVKETKV